MAAILGPEGHYCNKSRFNIVHGSWHTRMFHVVCRCASASRRSNEIVRRSNAIVRRSNAIVRQSNAIAWLSMRRMPYG